MVFFLYEELLRVKYFHIENVKNQRFPGIEREYCGYRKRTLAWNWLNWFKPEITGSPIFKTI